jgi:hypothetical protein
MKNKIPFNCGKKLKEIMTAQGWDQEAVAGRTWPTIGQMIDSGTARVLTARI